MCVELAWAPSARARLPQSICCLPRVHRVGLRLGYCPDTRRPWFEGDLVARTSRIVIACAVAVALPSAIWTSVSGALEPLAFQSVGGGGLSVGPPVNVVAGQGAGALGTVTITLSDGATAAGDGWATGDVLSLELASDPAGANAICDGTLTAPTVTATTGATTPLTGITLGTSTTATCGAQANARTLTLPAAPNDLSHTTIALAGMTVAPGANVANGAPIYLVVTASSGTPFGAAAKSAVAWVATVETTTLTASKVVGAPTSTLAVPIGDITATDVSGGTVHSSLVFTLAGNDTFAAPGKLTGPTGVVVAGPSETPPSSTLTFAIAGTSPAGGTYTLSGATVNVGGSGGVHNLTVATTPSGINTSSLVGNAVEFAVTAGEIRVAGVDRYATASALFADVFADPTRPHAVVVASGANYPDALSANVLAGELGTGVLLTDPTSLSAAVALELASDDIDHVYIVGGPAAVSAKVAAQIAAIHVLGNAANPAISVARFAGADRFATNNVIDEAAATGPTGGTAKTFDTAIVATGNGFADALAVGPIVYAEGIPLVLTDPATLSAPALQSLKDLQVKHVIIVGGPSAVSAAVEAALTAGGMTVVYRMAGQDRTMTAASIARWAASGLPATPTYKALAAIPGWLTNISTAWIARGDSFADALAAGPAAGIAAQSIVLTANPATLGLGVPSYFAGQGGTITELIALGGTAALTPGVLSSAITALGAPSTH
jgi:putative cell wall-binding protein